MQLEILKETDDWIAINKPTGIVVEVNPYETSVEAILKEKHDFVGIVHRLDRVTSGILLIAKKQSVLKDLNKQFRDRSVQKVYLALVEKEPKEKKEVLKDFLFKHQKNKKAFIYKEQKKKCHQVSLQYTVLKKQGDYTMLKVIPFTGKFHQIRAQLANIGCPIVDDTKYNGKEGSAHLKSIALQANRISFTDPNSKERVVVEIHENFRYKI